MSNVEVQHNGPVSIITMNRPDKLNALNAEVLEQLGRVLDEVDARDELRCAVITGAGKAFVAGADIAGMKDFDPDSATAFALKGQAVFARIEALRCPVVAAVNGFALGGGCELALACDFIIASAKAKFGQPEVKLGVIPGFGGTQRLARRVGIGHARELCYTGRMIRADEALAIGLVNRVVAPEELLPQCEQLAQEIATAGPLAVAAAKRVILEGEELLLREANEKEAKAFGALFVTSDQREGMGAFLEKREANFTAH